MKDQDEKDIEILDLTEKAKIKSSLGGSFNNKFSNLKVKYKRDPKKYALLIVAIIGLFSMLVGSSYAYLTYVSETDHSTTIEAGTLALEFENETNAISLDGAVPRTDSEGLRESEAYNFTIKNSGTIPATYVVSIENTCSDNNTYTIGDEQIDQVNKCIPHKYIKVGIKKSSDSNYTVYRYDNNVNTTEDTETVESDSLNNENQDYIIATGTLGADESEIYEMKLWLDYDTPNDYNAQGGKNIMYSGKLALNYEQGWSEE